MCSFAPLAPHDVLVDVAGDTNGHGESLKHIGALFVHRLVLTSVSPVRGSVAGGTVLTLVGDGFSADLGDLEVEIGRVPCHVTIARPEQIVCLTGPYAASEDPLYHLSQRLALHDAGRLPTAVTVRSRGMGAVCEGSCDFKYDVAITPLVDPSCTAATMHAEYYTWTVAVCGAGFASPVGANAVWLGGATGAPCTPVSGNSTSLICEAPALTTGAHSVSLYVDPNGFAASTSLTATPAFSAPLVVDRCVSPTSDHVSCATCPSADPAFESHVSSSTPTTTIVTGGATVVIRGAGFASHLLSANHVAICGRECRVTSATRTELRCLAPSMLPYPDWSGTVLHQSVTLADNDYSATPSDAVGSGTAAVQTGVRLGLAFRGFSMPPFAVPRQAYLTVPARPSSGQISMRLSAALASCASGNFDLGHQDMQALPGQATGADVVWEPPSWSGSQSEDSPDVSSLVSELTAHPDWVAHGASGQCVLVLTVTHASGDGARSWVLDDNVKLTVSYVLPDPLSQLGGVPAEGTNCSFTLAVDAAIVSPQSESYVMMHGSSGGSGSGSGRRLLESANSSSEYGAQPSPSGQRHGRVLQDACAASGWTLRSDVLAGRAVSTPPPHAVEVEARPSSCQRETQTSSVQGSFPDCNVQLTSNPCKTPSAWNTCVIKRNGFEAISGTPVEPTHPSGGLCAAALTPDTLEVTATGCWKTHLSGFQVELFGRFVEAQPLGALVVVVSCGVPWYKSEGFDQFYLPSRVDELHGILSTIGYGMSRDAMSNAYALSMVGIKGGTPYVAPQSSTITYRAKPFFAPGTEESLWHVEQRWRHDNLQPRPSAFVADQGLGVMKQLAAAVDMYVWSSLTSAPGQLQRSLTELGAHMTTAFDKFELQTLTRCPREDEVMGTAAETRWAQWDLPSCAGPCEAEWTCGATTSPCCLVSMQYEGFAPRVPVGAIERCNHWTDEGGQWRCGFWGWRGKIQQVIDYCEDTAEFGCGTAELEAPSTRLRRLRALSHTSSSNRFNCKEWIYNAHFWRNNRAHSGLELWAQPCGAARECARQLDSLTVTSAVQREGIVALRHGSPHPLLTERFAVRVAHEQLAAGTSAAT